MLDGAKIGGRDPHGARSTRHRCRGKVAMSNLSRRSWAGRFEAADLNKLACRSRAPRRQPQNANLQRGRSVRGRSFGRRPVGADLTMPRSRAPFSPGKARRAKLKGTLMPNGTVHSERH